MVLYRGILVGPWHYSCIDAGPMRLLLPPAFRVGQRKAEAGRAAVPQPGGWISQ